MSHYYNCDHGPYSLRVKDIDGKKWVTVTGPLPNLPKSMMIEGTYGDPEEYHYPIRIIFNNGYLYIKDMQPGARDLMSMHIGHETTFMYRSGLAVIFNDTGTTYSYYGIEFKEQKNLFTEYNYDIACKNNNRKNIAYQDVDSDKMNAMYVTRAKGILFILDCLSPDLQLKLLEAI